jgi:hypothetical protein
VFLENQIKVQRSVRGLGAKKLNVMYTAEISRNNPSCFLFIIDQSGSMSEKYSSVEKPKSEALAEVINKMLYQLVIRCSKNDGVRDYYHVGVIGYGKTSGVGSAFSGSLAGKQLVPISEIANNPAEIAKRQKKEMDDTGNVLTSQVDFPVWFYPTAEGGTPMTEAFRQANDIISNWLINHPNCFPPVVIHITDGGSTDGDPTSEMNKLTNKTSNDGNVILFNLHTHTSNQNSFSFPNTENQLPDEYSKMLFNGASVLPSFMRREATSLNLNLLDGAKAFVFNGDIDLIIAAIEIGTK